MDKLIIPYLKELDLEASEENISLLLSKWDGVKSELEIHYRNRDQQSALQLMRKGIVYFIQFLYCSNDRQVNSKEPIPLNQLEIKPVNFEERLTYILSRPSLFHSYRQLSELFTEQEKLFAKKNIVKKRLSQKG
ncbi:YpoC family protein [Neobacillus sp. 3P2-tot-E-2]|uniref:YpoC family protein n=1 Tax=Neobacillus sp. 3P2-tot-E-2 TaxID=3132212 RepID=UPI0039A16826